MCGIAALSDGAGPATAAADGDDPDEVHLKDIDRMLATLAHRGPDEMSWHLHGSGRATLGHTRLAIIDPEGGHQPLVGDDGVTAIANGEIYNHRTLRRDVPAGDLVNGSDSAVLLPLFAAHGPVLVDHLDGMYAFVLADADGTLVAGRDRLGIKPLYRGERGHQTAYASEMKALIAGGWEDIRTVPPGHVWVGDRLEQYYRLPEPNPGAPTGGEDVDGWIAELREALEAAVVKRLMSDVALGTFLSGGLDSSIITALAARHRPGLPTFALGFEGSADLLAARHVAEHLDTDHHEVLVSEEDAIDALPEVLYHLESWDRDLVRSALPTYLVARLAAETVKVVLTGEGADELFAGYRYHADYAHDPQALQAELHRSVSVMHDSNLQRVDRMTMAHSLEARVPFLDPRVVDVAMRIPAELKLRRTRDGRLVDKWILRRAFADLLPDQIAARPKTQFDEGSGTADRLPLMAAEALGEATRDETGPTMIDVEEAWYFEQSRALLGDWQTVQANTSVWRDNRVALTG